MNEDIGKPIAYGRTAEIYAWRNDQVLKLFYDWFGIENIKYKLKISQAVQKSGLPVPPVGGIIRINNRSGLTYQRVEGVSMLEMMSRKPWLLIRYAHRMAELHAELHASTIQADIPNLHQRLKYKINDVEVLSPVQKSKVLISLESMPGGNWLCHGDFHPGNIMVTGEDAVIIDWVDASIGNPLADLARTTIISLGAVQTNQLQNPLMKIAIRSFHAIYLRRYFSLRPGGGTEYVRWLPIVAAARLSENIPELEVWLTAQVEKGL
jgi:Ser/Thr protein kinase RdoA (MazF antagonist)